MKTMEDAAARVAIKDELGRYNIHVHQPDDPPLFTPTPQSGMRPVHWRWGDLVRLLERIGSDLGADSGGNRRTLRLANPGLAFGTTPTFWCSLQYILPGEVAGAHRHMANAMRFIIKGKGASSTVDGERYPFGEGDLVLTPSWCMHDHVHQGSEPMIWLDILDISLVRALDACFFEDHTEKLQRVCDIPARTHLEYGSGLMAPVRPFSCERRNPLLAYPYEMAAPALERASLLPGDVYDDTALEYRNPVDGSSVTTTMSARLLRLRPGFTGLARRHTGSKVYHVVSGNGAVKIGREYIEFTKRDFISIPPWATHSLSNPSRQPTTLLEVNDVPAHRALGFYREEPANAV